MANVAVANTSSNISGDTLLTAENNDTITGLKTFDRDPSAPFAVTASSAVVPNLDADKLDGLESTAFAQKAANETVTGVWTITGASGQLTMSGAVPGLYVSETDATANNKNWLIAVESELLTVQTRTDANAAVSNVLTVSRAGALTTLGGATLSSGNLNVTTGSINATASSINAGTVVTATSGFKEHSRSFNAGDTQTYAYGDASFAAIGGGTWTVGSGDWHSTYRIVGDTMWLTVVIDSSDVAGTVTQVRVTIPQLGGTVLTTENNVFPGLVSDNTETSYAASVCSTVPGGASYIRISKPDFSAFSTGTGNVFVHFNACIKIAGP